MRRCSFWTSLAFFVTCSGMMFAQQGSPLDAASLLAGGGLDGDWKNVNAQTRGIVRIVVGETTVHPYGHCSPAACDWGELHAQNFASRVDAHDRAALLVSQDTSFSKTVMTISLDSDGRLRVQAFTHYTDASRRADHTYIDYFSR